MFTQARPYVRTLKGSGIAATLRPMGPNRMGPARPRNAVLINIVAATQETLFGGPINGQCFKVEIGRDEHQGLLRIEKHPEGQVIAGCTIKGGAKLTLVPWDLLPQGSVPRALCTIERYDGNGVLIRLPEWAQQSVAAARMAAIKQEFALKPIGGVR